jgi:hypothetical protein
MNASPFDAADRGNLLLGIVGGAVAALIAAFIWAAITAATSFQIGYMAIGVGFAVAFAVRLLGRGHDIRFAIASAVLSLAGCVAGNFLSVVFAVAGHDHAPVLSVASALLPRAVDVLTQTFNIMDVVFYAIGTYFGFRYATTPLRPTTS